MPIRINLKELFPADAQEITIDKINFNFNKLLALGVGDAGPIGLSGIQGSAGPIGGTGSQGIRGTTWIVDGGPPSPSIPDLLDGDLYLDSNTFAVYQWDEATNSWTFIFDITAIVQSYLTNLGSPFVRGFGAGSPNDQRFILFGKRDSISDLINDSSSTNDVLFLSNYDETTFLNPPVVTGSPDTDTFYNALLTISVDERTVPAPPNALRSHIELGVLYDNANPTLTSVHENFKIRHGRTSGSIHGLTHRNTTTFSLDSINNDFTNRDFSSVFIFESPRYNTFDVLNTNSVVLVGSRYGLDEESPSATPFSTLADGIICYTGSAGANIGVAFNYVVPEITSALNTGYINNTTSQSYAMLDTSGTSSALFLNDKLYQNGGNIIQLGTTQPRLTGTANVLSLISTVSSTAMTHQGNKIISILGKTSVASITDPAQFASTYNETIVENPNFPVGHIAKDYANVPNAPSTLDFAGISDIAAVGDYVYCVKCLSYNNTVGPVTSRVVMQNIRTSESQDDQLPTTVGYLDLNVDPTSKLDCAHRIKLRGNLAVVTTNALPILPTVSNLGGNLVPGNTYDGRVVLVNITCPQTISVIDSVATTKLAGSTSSTRAAIMDMDVVDDMVYTLTWEQTPNGVNADVAVKVDAFSIEEADSEPTTSITWKTNSSSLPVVKTTFNSTDYNNLSKVGAICANKKYVYTGYSVISGGTYTPSLRIYQVKGGSTSIGPTPIPGSFTIDWVNSLTLSVPGQQINEISKIQQLGNSIYVLVNTVNAGNYLIKVDVSVPTSAFQVWYKNIGDSSEYYSNFVLKGKHIYAVNSKSVSSTSSIKAFEIDGFYTGAAHIESLRTEGLDVTQDFTVGNNAIINNELNVGGRTEITGKLGVYGSVTTCAQFIGPGTIPIGGIIMWSGSIASIPTGWKICDGTNGTPDLRERFIVGAGGDNPTVIGTTGYTPGNTGGVTRNILTRSNIPAHRHLGVISHFQDSDGTDRLWRNLAGQQSGSGIWTSFDMTGTNTGPWPNLSAFGNENLFGSNKINGGNNYGFYAMKYNSGDGTTNLNNHDKLGNGLGSVDAVENRPPYYSLAFIMRTV